MQNFKIKENSKTMRYLKKQKIDYFVLNNENQVPDFNLANIRAYEDRNAKKFNDLQLLEINKRLEKNKAIFNLLAFDNRSIIYYYSSN